MTNMTEGSTTKILWKFSLPMLISVIFQQIYNIADTVIAGTYINSDALAAIGASYPITMIFIAVATGINIGASVIISQLFGGNHFEKMKTAVFTSLVTTIILSIIITILGVLFCDSILSVLKTPDGIFEDSSIYLEIYIFGMFFLFLYNICNGVFVALGDSKTPLCFLIVSSILNILLDIVFVEYFQMGISGIAWATFIAQGVSSLFSAFILMRKLYYLKCGKYVIFSLSMLLKISRVAIPSILQQSFISVGNLFIQNKVNSFGEVVIAGYTAAIKLNTFSITSLTTLGSAVSSFAAQNFGAGKIERVKQCFKSGTVMMWIISVPFMICFLGFGTEMVGIFLSDGNEEIVEEGLKFLLITSPFYPIIAIKFVCDGILRGAGDMKRFMISTLTDFILRVVLAFILSVPFGEEGVWIAWPVGWVVASIMSYIFYIGGKWKKRFERGGTIK